MLRPYHGDKSAYKPEVHQMVRIDTGRWVDLQTVVIVAGILKQTVHRVQHIMGQVEKPFSATQISFQFPGKTLIHA
jgi:hypothetical protein